MPTKNSLAMQPGFFPHYGAGLAFDGNDVDDDGDGDDGDDDVDDSVSVHIFIQIVCWATQTAYCIANIISTRKECLAFGLRNICNTRHLHSAEY